MARRQGGQPGNVNALKHGFYSKRFDVDELKDIETIDAQGLSSEINMLRVYIRRVFDLSDGKDDLKTALNTLNGLSLAAARLASCLKTQTFLTSGQDESILTEITRAIAEINEEIKEDQKQK